MVISAIKAAGIAAIAGGGITTLAAVSGKQEPWIEFIKTFGLPTALSLFLLWAFWESLKRQNTKNDERDQRYYDLEREFRDAYKGQIAESNQLHKDTNAILVEQNKTLAHHSDILDSQSVTLREISQKLNQKTS